MAEFQWLTPEESSNLTLEQEKMVEMEIADVAIYLIRLADVLEIDIYEAVIKKIRMNGERFPTVK